MFSSGVESLREVAIAMLEMTGRFVSSGALLHHEGSCLKGKLIPCLSQYKAWEKHLSSGIYN